MDKDIKVRKLVIMVIAAALVTSSSIGIFLLAHYQRNRKTVASPQDASESTGVTNHLHDYITKIIPATCEDSGYTLYSCVCGDVYQTDVISANGHSYGEWEIVLDATSEAEGEKEKTCTVCGSKSTEAIPKLEAPVHEHTYTGKFITADCSTGGYTRYTCACGAYYDSNVVPFGTHSYGSFETIVWPTRTSTGTRQAFCEHCGHCLTETIPKLPMDDTELYEKYIDAGIEIRHFVSGWTSYTYKHIGVTDTRTWGDPPTIRITENDGFHVSYFNQEGMKIEYTFSPLEGYFKDLVIQESGSYTFQLFGDFK